MEKKDISAELVYSTNEGFTNTNVNKPVADVNVNKVRPVFVKKDKSEVPISSMTDEEIYDAIHFTEEFIEREQAKIDKMRKVQKYLMIESSSRARTIAEEEEPNYLIEG